MSRWDRLPNPVKRRPRSNTRLELFSTMQLLATLAARADVNPQASNDIHRARERLAAALSHLNQENDE